MTEFRIVSEIDILCSPQRLYDFVTTPDNWVGTHPLTKGVTGNTASSRGLGERWIELIEFPGGRRLKAEWRVVKADPPRLWQIRADNIGGIPVSGGISYSIEERAHADAQRFSHLRREQISRLPWYLLPLLVDKSLREGLTSRGHNDVYLKSVKDRLESELRRDLSEK